MKYVDPSQGFDAGTIVDGVVRLDDATGEYVIVDEDENVAFSSQQLFKKLVGKKIKFTCVSFETIAKLEQMIAAAQTQPK